jgi:signal transduction histidine kinase
VASIRERLRPGALPLVPFAPAIVVVVGIAVAVVMAAFGLVELRTSSDDAALAKAQALAAVMATRVRVIPAEDRDASMDRFAQRIGADLMLVDVQGTVLSDTAVGEPPVRPVVEMLLDERGFVDTATGRAAFAGASLGVPYAHLSVLAFVHAPAAPPGSRELLQAVSFLAAVLVSIAGYAAYRFSKNARDDVEFVRRRVERMAGAEAEPLGEEVPIRAFDQVGVFTSAFNELLERFAAAERTYRHDLSQADALDRARARFLATLSHELRTPLNAILGFADVLLSEVDGPLTASAREDLSVIRTSGEHLRALIDDVLDLSALEMGSLRLERRAVDAYAIAEEVVRAAAPQVQEKGLSISLSGDRATMAWADARRLRQILGNLVGNAVKFTGEGRVEVVVHRYDGAVVIDVTDTGPGIPEAERAGVFEEYRQVGDLASRRKGTGLGLAIARRLTAMHEGQLSLASETGKGSIFRVELPTPEGRVVSYPRIPLLPRRA